jgi:hypothetical protein
MIRAFALLALLACAGDPTTAGSCEECLDRGGTWQPEARACTEECDLQDVSCFASACPGPCGPGACDFCFNQGDCDAAGCLWRAEAEAQWCTTGG